MREENGDAPLNRMKGGTLAVNASSPEALGMGFLTQCQAQGKWCAHSIHYLFWISLTKAGSTSQKAGGRDRILESTVDEELTRHFFQMELLLW